MHNYYKFCQHYNTLGDFLATISLHMCRHGYCALCVKILTAVEFSDPDFL